MKLPLEYPARALAHGGEASLCDRAEAMLVEALDRQRADILRLLERCESPIEEIMLIALWDHWGCEVDSSGFWMSATLNERRWGGGRRSVVVEPQRILHAGDERYRTDFLVSTTHLEDETRVYRDPVVVEVDGHDFHEKTRFQAAYDRRRDRNMVAEGFRVVRFTGSEVCSQPRRCAAEVGRLAAPATGTRRGSRPRA